MKIIDSHTHTDYISTEYQSGVVECICCAKCESEWGELLDVINNDKNVYGAFGVHPWNVSDVKDGFDTRLYEILKTNRSWMVGEIGLDKYKPDMEKQIEVFIKQLDIAVELQRPIMLHCVGAWDKIFQILKQYKKSVLPIIVAHAFNGSTEIVENLVSNYNVIFSFNSVDKKDIISCIPNDKIAVETDAKSNVVLSDIVDKISNIKNTDMENIIYQNTKRILQNG